jgi:ubiquitin-protein ligase
MIRPRVHMPLVTSFTDCVFFRYQAELKIPKNYPMSPPEFRFARPLFHPNIYKDGKLCISILHAPGEDETSGELASVRLHDRSLSVT